MVTEKTRSLNRLLHDEFLAVYEHYDIPMKNDQIDHYYKHYDYDNNSSSSLPRFLMMNDLVPHRFNGQHFLLPYLAHVSIFVLILEYSIILL